MAVFLIMTKKKKHVNFPPSHNYKPITSSLLDKMVEGREFESLLSYRAANINIADEIRKSINEIKDIRKNPVICYVANIVNSNIKMSTSIEYNDELPFSEMVASIPIEEKSINIIFVTPGGLTQQIPKFVDKLRPRFEKATFILPNIAMSAGTIFAMSGDDIIMHSQAYIGPVDPQIPNRDGVYIPLQSILTLLKEIQERGEERIKNGNRLFGLIYIFYVKLIQKKLGMQ